MNFITTTLLLAIYGIFGYLTLKDMPLAYFLEKRITMQMYSIVIVLFRTCLLAPLCLIFIDGIIFFTNNYDGSYLLCLGIASCILNLILLSIFAILQSLFFNIPMPNDILPWSETSHKTYQLQVIFKGLLTVAYRVR